MKKYSITDEDREFLKKVLAIEGSEENVMHNPQAFLHYFLDIEPYLWQSVFLNLINGDERFIAATTPRQVGKTTTIASESIRNAYYNLKPIETTGTTRIGIISATEPQSMKIIEDIKTLMYRGDEMIARLTGGKVKKYFTSKISYKGTNKSVIKFKNNCDIISVPATDAARGYTFSMVFVDEAAFLRDSEFLEKIVEPTVRKSRGKIILTTTPDGVGGAYYELFDPEDKRSNHSYSRLWFGRESIEEPDLLEFLDNKKKEAEEKGTLNLYLQEYEADFTSSISMFFDPRKIDMSIDENLVQVYSYTPHPDEKVAIGVDFGMTYSHTVVSVVRSRIVDDKHYADLLAQYVYSHGDDLSLPEDVKGFMKRYGASFLVVDDCAEGYHFIQRMETIGLAPYKFSFRREKVESYYSFRQFLNQGRLKIFKDDGLLMEMRSLREDNKSGVVKIEKAYGATDDRIASLVMATYPFLGNSLIGNNDLRVILV